MMTINSSKMSHNSAAYGGAIFNDSGYTLTISDSNLSHNSAGFDGGAIFS